MGREEETIQSALVGFSFKLTITGVVVILVPEPLRELYIVHFPYLHFPKASKLMMQKKKKIKGVHSSSLFPLLCFLIG